MSIDVVIKQKLFGRKTMPLEVILGSELRYGNFVNDRLNAGELGESEFVAYHPGHIGQGFSVVWTPGEKKSIALRLPQPSTAQELADFYAAVERMASYWDARLIADGRRIGLSGFLAGLKDMVAFNDQIIRRLSRQVLDGAQDNLILYSVMWPLTMGREEAAAFSENPLPLCGLAARKAVCGRLFRSSFLLCR